MTITVLLVALLVSPVRPAVAGPAAEDSRFVTGQAAVAVVGQKSFSANVPGAGADELGTATGLAIAGDRLIVCDGGLTFTAPSNHRILIFNNLSALAAGASASVVIGQDDFGKNSPGLSEKAFSRPAGVSTDGQKLAVADSGNNRVLIFNRIPTANAAAADVVVGQGDFKTGAPELGDTRMRGPSGVFLDGRRLFVADTLNHRVLIFNSVPTSNGAKADVLLGQADFNSRADQAASASSLRDPTAVFFDGVRLIVTDLGHNRVLIYNRIPTSNNAAADIVVGQPDFTTDVAGTGPASLNFPRYAFTDGARLFIADTGNNRVLVFNQIPTGNGAAADAALGQRDFQSSTDPEDNSERLTAGVMGLPVALASTGSGVLVADSSHRRVLKFVPGVQLFSRGSVLSAANFGGNGLARPPNVQVEVQPDGTLPAGDYFIKVTAEGGILFESTPSEEVAVTVPDKSKLVVTFDETPGATSYRVYVGGSPGGQSRYFTTATPAAGEPIARSVEISSLTTANLGGPRLEVTPGNMAVMFGRDLAPQIALAEAIPLPRELAGVSVVVNGVAAPLFFVSPGQINFQVPWETLGTNASVLVQKRSASGQVVVSNAVAVGVSDLTPGVFTASGDGVGRPLAYHADGSLITDEKPLEAGEDIFFFLTGVQQVAQLGDLLAVASVDNRTRGEITVTADGMVTWSTTNVAAARVFASVDGGQETLFSESPSGSGTADFLTPGHLFRFILRVVTDDVAGSALAIATIDTRDAGVNPPSGEITVAAPATVTWSTSHALGARVFVSVDGAPEIPFADGLAGRMNAGFVALGHLYRFVLRLLVDGVVGSTLAEATLDTRTLNETSGQLTVTPQGAVTWSSSNAGTARVYVAVDGGQEAQFADGTEGNKTTDTDFLQPGHFYRFTLRKVVGGTPALTGEASPPQALISTTVSVAIQGRDAPVRFAGLAPGLVGVLQFNVKIAEDLELDGLPAEVRVFVGSIPANQTFLPVKDAATGEISVTREGVVTWSTTLVLAARVYLSADGGDEALFADGLSGTQTADFIAPGHVYRFILRRVVNDQPEKILAVATLDTRT